MNLLINDKLEAWLEGANLKAEKRNYNTSLALSAIAGLGAATAGLSSNRGTQLAGLGVTAAAAGIALGKDLSTNLKQVHSSLRLPKNHLLNSFFIAPQSYVRKWIVVSQPKTKKTNETDIEFHDRRAFFIDVFTELENMKTKKKHRFLIEI